MNLLRPLLSWSLRRGLRQRFSWQEQQQIIPEIWRIDDELAQNLPDETALGARLMVRTAALTASVYRALCNVGMEEDKARELTARITWSIYDKLAMLSWRLTRLFTRHPLKRVKRVMDWFMRFPYTPPGYDMRYVDAGENIVAIDVHRCPAADYFGALELSELCVSSWCNLDYPLAERWGVVLVRSQTLAAGAPYCNFRFRRNDENKAV